MSGARAYFGFDNLRHVLITVDASNTVLIKNVTLGNLHSSDFLFA